MAVSRRRVLQAGLGAVPGYLTTRMFAAASSARKLAPGPFQPTWESLRSQYKTPEWFRDAKFGIWAHWSAQCVPEQGDWYARQMYLQGHPQYEFHCKTYGHPSKFGFMQIDHMWKAERWQPEELMGLYKKAGAKYFMALANHHDNLDTYASSHHAWNTLNVGPKKDIIGTWAKTAREHGLRFGVSNHSAHSWHWFQTAYGYDPEGPMAGVRYDAYNAKKADGKGQWWQGLDPQKLYNGPIYAMPDGIKTIKEANEWHGSHDRKWDENPPAGHQEFVDTWFLRCQELLDKYQPDMIYFDDSGLPLGQAGLDVTAHYYNTSAHKHGSQQCVVFAKELPPEHLGAVTLDIERGKAKGILDTPWQTDTCIGDWHYNRRLFTEHKYKSAKTVIAMLVDIVSKNGNLLLSVPVRGDGSLDEDEHKFLGEMADWMSVHGEAIYETRPWKFYGEGPEDNNLDGHGFNESKARVLGAEDVRFTQKGNTLYATVLGWPENGKLSLKTVTPANKKVAKVAMLGGPGDVKFTQTADGLTLQLPEQKKEQAAYSFRIEG